MYAWIGKKNYTTLSVNVCNIPFIEFSMRQLRFHTAIRETFLSSVSICTNLATDCLTAASAVAHGVFLIPSPSTSLVQLSSGLSEYPLTSMEGCGFCCLYNNPIAWHTSSSPLSLAGNVCATDNSSCSAQLVVSLTRYPRAKWMKVLSSLK